VLLNRGVSLSQKYGWLLKFDPSMDNWPRIWPWFVFSACCFVPCHSQQRTVVHSLSSLVGIVLLWSVSPVLAFFIERLASGRVISRRLVSPAVAALRVLGCTAATHA
jgi:hypothetical protein